MDENIIITLKGLQSYQGSHDDTIELVTSGKYSFTDDTHYITYEESVLTGFEGTTTTLEINGGKVTLLRSGTKNSQLIFERGQRHLCCYETPYGAFSICVRADDVNVALEPSGGEISAKYQLEIDNLSAGYNQFHLTYTAAAQ